MNSKYTIATLGGHSALEICLGAHKRNFKTLVIVQTGRDKTYTRYFKNLVDDIITVESFAELTNEDIIKTLQEKNCIFIPHRYCQVYCDLSLIEKKFNVPVFGNKYLLKYEEREGVFNQYQLLYNAQVDYPKQFKNPKDIDRLCIVKVKEAARGYERAFFFAKSFDDYRKATVKLLREGRIKKENLQNAIIEEYIVGAQINFNFFYSPLQNRVELISTDMRRQTNIDGLMRIPAGIQLEISNYINPSYIETGHIAVTVKESLLERAFIMAERVLEGSRLVTEPGIIGPFAIQTAIVPGPPAEKMLIYDLSLRIPGSPGSSFTPYSAYLFGESLNFGERIAMEIEHAIKDNLINKITT